MKVGDYVRTKKDGIGRIISFSYQEDDECCFIELPNRRTGIKKFNIIKSSPSIIDLIEKFDLVNGHLVICKMYENEKDIPTIVKCVGEYYFKEEDIKSIVTKEQFEAMKYEIK